MQRKSFGFYLKPTTLKTTTLYIHGSFCIHLIPPLNGVHLSLVLWEESYIRQFVNRGRRLELRCETEREMVSVNKGNMQKWMCLLP